VKVMLAAVAAAVSLEIVVWPAGRGGRSTRRTLTCAPTGGTVPQPARACRRLAAMPDAFAPLPADAACTQQWDGPEEALVTGVFGGKRVRLRLSRANGCAIAQWDSLRFLLAR